MCIMICILSLKINDTEPQVPTALLGGHMVHVYPFPGWDFIWQPLRLLISCSTHWASLVPCMYIYITGTATLPNLLMLTCIREAPLFPEGEGGGWSFGFERNQEMMVGGEKNQITSDGVVIKINLPVVTKQYFITLTAWDEILLTFWHNTPTFSI